MSRFAAALLLLALLAPCGADPQHPCLDLFKYHKTASWVESDVVLLTTFLGGYGGSMAELDRVREGFAHARKVVEGAHVVFKCNETLSADGH